MVEKDEDLVVLSEYANTQSKGIVLLGWEYTIGADVKFKDDAKVIAYCKEIPDREELIQMVGRSNRAGGDYTGTIYFPKNEDL